MPTAEEIAEVQRRIRLLKHIGSSTTPDSVKTEIITKEIQREKERKRPYTKKPSAAPSVEPVKPSIVTEPVAPMPEPVVEQKDVEGLTAGEHVVVTWEKPGAWRYDKDRGGRFQLPSEMVSVHVRAGRLSAVQSDIREKGGHIVKVETTKGDAFYKAPTRGEWEETVSEYHKKEYEESGYIPPDIHSKIEQDIPEAIHLLGLEDEYIRASYESSIGVDGSDDFEKQYMEAYENLPDEQKIQFMQQYGTFGEDGVSWAEFVEEKPGSKVRIQDDKVVVVSSEQIEFESEQRGIERRMSGGEGLGGHLVEFGRFWFSGFTPENLLYHRTISNIISGDREKIFRDYTASTLKTEKALKEHGWLGVFGRSYEPGGFGFIGTVVPLLVGGFKAAGGLGAGLGATKAGTALSAISSKGPWVALAIGHGIVGAEIGLTAAEHKHEALGGWGSPAVREKVIERTAQFGLAYGLGYMATSPKTGGRMELMPGRTVVSSKQVPGGVLFTRHKYVEILGRGFSYGPRQFQVLKPGFEPDITSYAGIPQRDPMGVTFTPSRTGPFYPPRGAVGVEPIPRGMALVPYQSMVPSTRVGIMPIVFKGVVPGTISVDPESFFYRALDISPFPSKVKSPVDIISWRGTPRDLMKPLGYREVMGRPKYMPDIKEHKEYPLKEIPLVDWMDTSVPSGKALSTEVFPKPMVYRGRMIGVGGIAVTPFTGVGGPGMVIKPWGFLFGKDIIPSVGPKPRVRVVDTISGKQIGHEFVDLSSRPIIPKEKPGWPKAEPDYRLSPEQIHYEISSMDVGDVLKTPKDIRKNILGKRLLEGRGFLPSYDSYMGEAIGISKPPGTGLIVRPTTALTKRSLFLLFGFKPIIFGVVGFVPEAQPAITGIRGFKGRTFTLEDLTKKWEMEKSDMDHEIIYAKGSREQQLLLEKPVVETREVPVVKKISGEVELEKVSSKDLVRIGRFDLEQPLVFPPATDTKMGVESILISGIPLSAPSDIKQGVLGKPETSVVQRTDIDQVLSMDVGISQVVSPVLDVGTKSAMDVISISIVETDLGSVQAQAQVQAPVLDIFSKQVLEQVQKRKRIFGFPDGGMDLRHALAPVVYEVHVKPRQWVNGERVNPGHFGLYKGVYTLFDAMAVGGHFIDNNAKASFKVVPVEGKAKPRPRGVPSWGRMSDEFYPKGNGVFVENPSSRIDSPGELREITERGIAARKRMGSSKKKNSSGKKQGLGFVKNMDKNINRALRGV